MTPPPDAHTGFLTERFREQGDKPAIVASVHSCTFAELLELQGRWAAELDGGELLPGTVVGLEGDFTPSTVALFLALLERTAIVVPHGSASRHGRDEKDEIAQVEAYFYVDEEDTVSFERTGRTASHELFDVLRRRRHPGVVGFSSGTSGEAKAAVHDFASWLESFAVPRPALCTLSFLLFDHLGGVRTMLHTLANGGTMVSTRDRSPDAVCALIERHRIELLPATPTFFNLLLLSGAHRRHDLSSLEVISYGAEPMHQSTLDRLREAFPDTKLVQTYGLIETGPMRSKSRGDGSLWLKLGGEGIQTRVVDGILQIRSPHTTLGYLNAPTPITEDGWFVTGDAVEQEGEFVRILGRDSELINVGGRKVYPAEVESVIQSLEEVEDAAVYGEPNRIVGQIVCATVSARSGGDPDRLVRDVKRRCRERLDRFKVPVKVRIADEAQVSARFKKIRSGPSGER